MEISGKFQLNFISTVDFSLFLSAHISIVFNTLLRSLAQYSTFWNVVPQLCRFGNKIILRGCIVYTDVG